MSGYPASSGIPADSGVCRHLAWGDELGCPVLRVQRGSRRTLVGAVFDGCALTFSNGPRSPLTDDTTWSRVERLC